MHAANKSREAKQERSALRQQRILEATIELIAENGVASVNHRLIAKRADVSLAATTYHFATKSEIISRASALLLEKYIERFDNFAARQLDAKTITFRDFAMRVVCNAAEKNRQESLAWCEIMLHAARNKEARIMAQDWYNSLGDIWKKIADALDEPNTDEKIQSAIDIVVGMLFVVIPLGISEHDAKRSLIEKNAPDDIWSLPKPPDEQTETPPKRRSKKSKQTRAAILASAIDILTKDGPGGLTYQAVAEHSGLVRSAPIYHYPTMASLLSAAQACLFAQSKDRYREVMSGVNRDATKTNDIIELTVSVFRHEAKKYGAKNLASLPIWLEAARQAEIRPVVWDAFCDQNKAWERAFARIGLDAKPLDALILHRLFVGKLVRALATGSDEATLSRIHDEFAFDIRAIFEGSHWAS